MIPLEKDAMRNLLELKDIALLYELGTFFRLADEITAVLESPPVRSPGLPAVSSGSISQPAGPSNGCRVCRSPKGHCHSYSVPLRPDIALSIPDGPNSGLHLFDAKFRVQGLSDAGLTGSDKDGDDDKAGERAGTFKRGDIYKMHAYRDAIPYARSVWILYPGTEFRFFAHPGDNGMSGGEVVSSPEGLAGRLEGVGAIPLGPVVGDGTDGGLRGEAANDASLRATLRRVMGGGNGMSTLPYIP